MPKAPITIYIRVALDNCTVRVNGSACGLPRSKHPLNYTGELHEYQGGRTDFVYPTDTERRKIYEQLKEEFDA